jgi:hypothetical protein
LLFRRKGGREEGKVEGGRKERLKEGWRKGGNLQVFL